VIEGRPPDDASRGDDSGLGDADWRPKLPDPEPTELGPPTPIEEIPVVDPSSIPDPLETGEWKTAPDPFDTGVHRAAREGQGDKKKRKGKKKRGETDTRERRLAGSETAAARPPATSDVAARPSDSQLKRRRLGGLLGGIFVVAILVLLIVLLVRGCGGGGGSSSSPTVSEMIGQTIIGKVGDAGPSKGMIKRVERGQISGVLMGAGRPEDADRYAAKLQKAAARGGQPPVLVMIDQEGGYVKRLPGPPDIGPNDMEDAGGEDAALTEGRKTGEFLKPLGVNVNLAPVVDVAHDDTADTIVSRTYSSDPTTVGRYGAAFVEGMQGAGVAATPKHFPALGLATENTDFAPVTVDANASAVQADVEAFRAPIKAGARLVMVSSAVYPAVSGDEQAVYSTEVIDDLLRNQLGFKGVVISDDLEAPAAGTTPGDAAFRAIRAGVDLVLFAGTNGAAVSAFDALEKSFKKGRLDRSTLRRAYDRIQDLKNALEG
jgi:beta-N-acetylhexosaminidase